MSNLSVHAHISTLPLPLNCKFKMVTRTWSPEVTVAFMIVGMPGYLLSSGKSELSSGKADDMIAEKMSSERKFCKSNVSDNLVGDPPSNGRYYIPTDMYIYFSSSTFPV